MGNAVSLSLFHITLSSPTQLHGLQGDMLVVSLGAHVVISRRAVLVETLGAIAAPGSCRKKENQLALHEFLAT